ncbi:UV DNA damage repair endonuclease UvsE [Clostridium sp. CS001]|uniref:UV DNA damage repair endonuclease UvsE n=1 Tax=Clostridium sp. CS001 TaxID=2880648 RepID=UPI001CF5127D|nr:UV DNA damage repair endonuclease UvsE [Clostridium sp. CS001]MCB2291074.1 UV DNA damage repair endonuclease UvsE [Clostridium sp. CS001]
MQIRLGYVATALKLGKVTSSSTVTYSTYTKQSTDRDKLEKLQKVAVSNVNDLYKILEYTVKNNIHFYRITSALIPLANHPEVTDWEFRRILKMDFEWLGNYIRNNDLRVDMHPDESNVLNTSKEEVLKTTIKNLQYHSNLFQDINYPLGKMVLHIGGKEGGKLAATERFYKNFNNLPQELSNLLIFENDDKSFTTKEVLNICKDINKPMVLDVHHHLCNNGGEELEPMLKDIFDTWEGEPLPPKVHFSTPKAGDKDKKHADFIDAASFIEFIEMCIPLGIDFDVMLEAKQADLALYQLVDDIKSLKPDWNWLDTSTLEIK